MLHNATTDTDPGLVGVPEVEEADGGRGPQHSELCALPLLALSQATSPLTLSRHPPLTLQAPSPLTLQATSPLTLSRHPHPSLSKHPHPSLSPGTLTPPLLHRWRTLSMRACTRKWSTHSLMMLTMNWRTRGDWSTFRPTLALRMTNHAPIPDIF